MLSNDILAPTSIICYDEDGDVMRIDKIKKVGDGKYKLTLQNKDVITTYDDIIIEYKLLYRKEIDEEVMEELLHRTLLSDVYHKSVKKITTKLMSEKEYKKWVEKYQLCEEELLKVVNRLKEVGLLNDKRFAKAYVSDKARLSKYGPYQIERDLENLGIDSEDMKEAMLEIDEQAMYEKLEKAILKKVKQNHKHSEMLLKQKIVSEFSNLGYGKEEILSILNQISVEENIEVVRREYQKIYAKLSKKYEGNELRFQVKNKLYQKGFSKESIDACME